MKQAGWLAALTALALVTPARAQQVANFSIGGIQIGDNTAACGSTYAGAMRFAAGLLQYCDGTTWQSVGGGSAAGSTGQVQFNSGGAFGADSNLFWDDTNKRLGIGTTTPQGTFEADVAGSGYANTLNFNNGLLNQTPTLFLSNNNPDGRAVDLLAGTFGSSVVFDNGGFFSISTDSKSNVVGHNEGAGDTPLVTVTANGYVGIGTNNPNAPLQVGNGGADPNDTPSLLISNTGDSGFDILNSASGDEAQFWVYEGDVWVGSYSNMPMIVAVGDNEVARFDTAGRFGIGTSTPQATLDVNGYMRLAKNSAQPRACSSTDDGAIALTHVYTLCVCNGSSSSWVQAKDGSTACSW